MARKRARDTSTPTAVPAASQQRTAPPSKGKSAQSSRQVEQKSRTAEVKRPPQNSSNARSRASRKKAPAVSMTVEEPDEQDVENEEYVEEESDSEDGAGLEQDDEEEEEDDEEEEEENDSLEDSSDDASDGVRVLDEITGKLPSSWANIGDLDAGSDDEDEDEQKGSRTKASGAAVANADDDFDEDTGDLEEQLRLAQAEEESDDDEDVAKWKAMEDAEADGEDDEDEDEDEDVAETNKESSTENNAKGEPLERDGGGHDYDLEVADDGRPFSQDELKRRRQILRQMAEQEAAKKGLPVPKGIMPTKPKPLLSSSGGADESQAVPNSLRHRIAQARAAMQKGKKKTTGAGSSKLGAAQVVENIAEHSDSEDEEGHRNRIGNVPLEWYDEYDHIGYDVYGKRIARSDKGDSLDELLARADDPNRWRTVYDALNDRKIVLSQEEMDIIQRIRHGKVAVKGFDYFDTPVIHREKHFEALGNAIEPKRRFLPSKHERKQVVRFIYAMRNGWIKNPLDKVEKSEEEENAAYMLWDKPDDIRRPALEAIPPPKPPLPGHAESYNPPEEYLPTEEEIAAWELLEPEDRPYNFIPTKHNSMREVGAYNNFIKERFERCLDLYLCPRTRRKRLNIDPDSLIPKLPQPRDLRPFPTSEAIEYIGHQSRVRSISPSPDGQWLASGSDDGTVRLWEVDTGRCFHSWVIGAVVDCVAWNPNPAMPLLAIAAGNRLFLVHTRTGSEAQTAEAEKHINGEIKTAAALGAAKGAKGVSWLVGKDSDVVPENERSSTRYASDSEEDEEDEIEPDDDEETRQRKAASKEKKKKEKQAANAAAAALLESEVPIVSKSIKAGRRLAMDMSRLVVELSERVKTVIWHRKGDYFASCSSSGSFRSVHIHRLSQHQTQSPFSKGKGALVQKVLFHPHKPFFFVATKRHVRVYNLVKQEMAKKLQSPARWISSIDIHPQGDNLIIGSYDRRVCWFDLDLSSKPYKTLKYHQKAVRGVVYHPTYPMFASCSDDGKLHVFHGMVYSDLLTNPLIVPVKVLNAHQPVGDLGVLSCAFHPTQPFIFSSGADGVIRMFT